MERWGQWRSAGDAGVLRGGGEEENAGGEGFGGEGKAEEAGDGGLGGWVGVNVGVEDKILYTTFCYFFNLECEILMFIILLPISILNPAVYCYHYTD